MASDTGSDIQPKEVSLDNMGLEILLEGPEGKDFKDQPKLGTNSADSLTSRKAILTGLYFMNYRKPSKVQATALPLILKGHNLLCQSQTGTGKTACYALAMIHMVDVKLNKPQALCIAPTRELARQIIGYINTLCRFDGEICTELAIPGQIDKKSRMPFEGHIVVGTPGTVVDCLNRKIIQTEHLKILIMDEADNLLEMQGLGDQASRVRSRMPKSIQVLLFSATFSENVVNYAATFAPGAIKLTLERHELTMKGIKQIYIDCKDEEDKYRVLVDLYHTMCVGSSIIFVKKRVNANQIAERMRADGHVVAVLHSALDSVAERDEIIDAFRRGRYKSKVLITTNLLARGIDVATTSLVINYDLPRMVDDSPDYVTYLHRIGRTGRFGRSGVSVSFVHDKRSWEELKQIQAYYGVPIHLIPADHIEVLENLMKLILKNNVEVAARYGSMNKSRHAPPGEAE
ncbi:P-loop containing nucleoside triphosphate hydrolase protein [Sphaerosporella brunnea]|uniref:RNA helicase n=1 Tax=Sphaerosporella brunnea TaxID=1250544 RepID=A0A5J5F536_9PEZI|nr:P-loop containing nucleoside triphosphate hydrolase protein [Sphaerosporella brunnea]